MTAIAVAFVIIPLSSSLAPLFPSTYYSLSTSSQAYSMLWAEKKKRGWRLSMQDNDHVYNENINNSKEKVLQYPNQRQYATTKSLKSDKTNTNNKWMISELSLREILTSFEDVVIQQKQPRKMTVGRRQDNNYRYEIDIDELINSMVDDLLLVFDSNDANDHQHQQPQQQKQQQQKQQQG